MDHEPHVRFVDAHAEGVGGHHHARLAREPLLLPQRPLGVSQSAVVGGGRRALLTQEVGDLLGALPRADEDDARAGDVADQPQQLSVLVVGAADAVREVGARETAAQNVRFGEFQVAHDVVGHCFRGRGGERQHGDAGESFAQFGDALFDLLLDLVRLGHAEHVVEVAFARFARNVDRGIQLFEPFVCGGS